MGGEGNLHKKEAKKNKKKKKTVEFILGCLH